MKSMNLSTSFYCNGSNVEKSRKFKRRVDPFDYNCTKLYVSTLGINCHKVPLVDNGDVIPNTCLKSGAKYEEKCYLVCNSGYDKVGEGEIKCMSNGSYDGVLGDSNSYCTKSKYHSFIHRGCPVREGQGF